MAGVPRVEISYAFEGPTDAAVIRRLIAHVGAVPGAGRGGKGKSHLLQRLNGYNAAAAHGPWFVLIDLDQPTKTDDCPVRVRRKYLPTSRRYMCFRIAVREVEAWLLGDRARFASYFAVPERRISTHPETLADPKLAVIELMRRSRSREMRADVLPTDPRRQIIGPGYSSRMIGFASDERAGWRPEIAANACESLSRALTCLARIAAVT